MKLDDSVANIQGIGDVLTKKLLNIGIRSASDLINYYPRKYNDFSQVSPISDLRPGIVTVKGKFNQISGRYVRRGMHITEAILSDNTGSVRVIWFNQPYRAKNTSTKEMYYVSGKFELNYQRLSILNPSTEKLSEFQLNTARIVPVYPEKKGIKSTLVRKSIKNVLDKTVINELIPKSIIKDNDLISKKQAIRLVHFPESNDDVLKAKRRLGFEEVFELVLANLIIKNELTKSKAIKIGFNNQLVQEFVKSLPFKLTDEQKACAWQIYQEIDSDKPMNRLIEGDVGSGKTVVAAMVSAVVAQNKLQTIILAPTEILARQHAETLKNMLAPIRLENYLILLVGAMTKKQKLNAKDNIKTGRAKIIVGTHALLQENIDFHNIGLVIVDEQHRFGVDQRRNLLKKAGHMPHLLSMTATPIPRSLALTVYGDLDISLIKTKPKNRQVIKTKIISQNERTKTYQSFKRELKNKNQIFVVCPLIDDSATIKSRSVSEVYKELSEKIFKDFKVNCLHGKMKSEEKQKIMNQFVEGKTDVLVSTTVIEVGVDIPNATVMAIESPERFGLAQIHQLRGRVGRGTKEGICLLMQSDNSKPSKRLSALENINSGFELSELDMQIRGPGAIYGVSQHGDLDLRMVDFNDVQLIKSARDSAKKLFNKDPNLLQYKQLKKRIEKLQKITHLN